MAAPARSATNQPASILATTHHLQFLTGLARYQAETGDLAAADQSLSRAAELLSANRDNQPAALLDAFNRDQVNVLAIIASQQYQRQERVAAQAKWYRATNLANAIVSTDERVQAFSSLAYSLQGVNAATASSYFYRAMDNARTLSDPAARSVALSAIARDLAGASRSNQAQELFAQAMSAAASLSNIQSRLATLSIIAKHYAEAGDNAVAQELLGQIASQAGQIPPLPQEFAQYRADAQSAIARNFAIDLLHNLI